MHILEIPSFFPPYGGLFCLDQAKALAGCGHKVRILSCVQLGVTVTPRHYFLLPSGRRWTEMDGIEVYQTYQRCLPRCYHRNRERYVDIVCSMYDDYVHRHGTPDIIHAHCAYLAGVAAMRLKEKHGVEYVITEHMSSELYDTPLIDHSITRRAMEQSGYVITVSDELVADIMPFVGDQYCHQTVSNTIDTSFFLPHQRSVTGTYHFVCLAIFTPRKCYDVLLQAFAEVVKQYPNTKLHIAGNNTDNKEMYEMIRLNGVEQNVVVHGSLHKPEVRQLLYKSHCLVLASRSEVQPLVLLEAAATGIPYISTDVTPKSLRIDDISTIVPKNDAHALASAMETMVDKHVVIDAENAHRRVCEMASPEVIGKVIEQIFLNVNATRK